MRLITFSSTPDDVRAAVLRRSCQHRSASLESITCMHTREKPDRVIGRLRQFEAEEVVCCVDGFDVLCGRPLQGFEETFRSLNAEVIFGAERHCFHHLPEVREWMNGLPRVGPYGYLNGGMFAGTAAALIDMMESLLRMDSDSLSDRFRASAEPGHAFNDQTLFGLYAMRNPDSVRLDRNANLFWNLWGDYDRLNDLVEFRDGTLVNRELDSRPWFIHMSQIDKFYWAYLSVALQAGVALDQSCIDFRQWFNIEEKFNDGLLPAGSEASERLLHQVSKMPAYRWYSLQRRMQKSAKRIVSRVSGLSARLRRSVSSSARGYRK